MLKKVQIKTDLNDYQIIIENDGLLSLGEHASKVWTPRKVAVISDDNVGPLYFNLVRDGLEAEGFETHLFTIPAGESSKSLNQVANLVNSLTQRNFNKNDGIIALGGGVVGDLAGFVAATYMSGMNIIQVPTSLLAQVDSSIGGKTFVNLHNIKNVLGSFHQPKLVIIDPQVLYTLSSRDVIEGYGEVVKEAALCGGDFWTLIQNINSPEDIVENAEELIYSSIQYKANLVNQDELELGNRKFLNFGHTIGHGIEALAYDDLKHGEAVSVGLVTMSQIFENQGWSQPGTTKQIKQRLEVVGLPTASVLLNNPYLIEKIKNDKKNNGNHIDIIYLKEIGNPQIKSVMIDDMNQMIEQFEQFE